MASREILFDYDGILKDIERTLGGYVEVKKGEWVRKDECAYLSESGVVKVMSIIKLHLNKSISLSDLTTLFIRRKRIAITVNLFKNILINSELFGIKDDMSSLYLIIESIDTVVYASLRQAKDGATSMRYYNSVKQDIKIGDRDNSSGLAGL